MNRFNTRILTVALYLIVSVAATAKTTIDGICYDLNSKTLEATVTYLGERSFTNYNPPKYTASSIEIPSEVKYDNKTYKVTTIGSFAFYECTEVKSIKLPNTITSIEYKAFQICTSLTSINLPTSIKDIETSAFASCHSLKSITIPEGVTTIAQQAFYGCESLTSIVLPSTITFISPEAFLGCNALKSVTVKSPMPIDMFNDTFEIYGKLYVPKGSKEAYSKAPIWKNFTIIESEEATGIEGIQRTTPLSSDKIFSLSGQSLTSPRKGVNIINEKKVVVK